MPIWMTVCKCIYPLLFSKHKIHLYIFWTLYHLCASPTLFFLLLFRLLLKHGVHYLSLPTCSLITKVEIPPSSTVFNGVLPDHQFPCPLNEKSVLSRTWVIKMTPVAKYISPVEVTYHHLVICNVITLSYIVSPNVRFFFNSLFQERS